MQTGGYGVSYVTQNLYSGVLSRLLPGTTATWGPVLTWEKGLSLAGGAHMQHLRACRGSMDS